MGNKKWRPMIETMMGTDDNFSNKDRTRGAYPCPFNELLVMIELGNIYMDVSQKLIKKLNIEMLLSAQISNGTNSPPIGGH